MKNSRFVYSNVPIVPVVVLSSPMREIELDAIKQRLVMTIIITIINKERRKLGRIHAKLNGVSSLFIISITHADSRGL
eukprot:scaffold120195_cov53-Attheya_sp.AAC.2